MAYGVLEDRYHEGINVDEGMELAIRALYNAMKRDSASGNGIDVVKITANGYERIETEEVDKILENLK
jgi:proteasome beta subunit